MEGVRQWISLGIDTGLYGGSRTVGLVGRLIYRAIWREWGNGISFEIDIGLYGESGAMGLVWRLIQGYMERVGQWGYF